MQQTKERMIRLAYILGVALVIAGLIYFFASNWQGFSKEIKLLISIGVMLLFYGLSYGFYTFFFQHQFLSSLLLLSGCFAFGIGVALIGQIYNSHANSYLLFSVWLVAAFLFSVITKYQPFYFLSYILIHLSVWLYFFPEGDTGYFDKGYVLAVFMVMIAVNMITFIATEREWFLSRYIRILSYITVHVFFIMISFKFFLEPYFPITNIVYVLFLAGCFYYFLKIQQQHVLITITGIVAVVYAISKYIELLIEHFGPPIFIATIIIGIAVVYANVYIVKKLKARVIDDQPELTPSSEEVQTDTAPAASKYAIWQNLVTVLLTVLSSLVITVSLTFLMTDMIGNFEKMATFFFFMGLLLFLIPGYYIYKRSEVIGGTVMCIGFLMTAVSVVQLAAFYLLIWLAIGLLGLLVINNSGIRILLYGLIQVILTLKLSIDVVKEMDIVCLLILAINVAVVLIAKKKSHWFPDAKMAESIHSNGFFYALLAFFALTFMEGIGYRYGLYIIYNVLFFTLSTALVFWAKNTEKSYEFKISMAFWFAFLFYKYYDLVWQLLHKSMGLIILGILFLVIANWVERKYMIFDEKRVVDKKIWTGNRKALLVGLILLQLVFMGTQIGSSEYALINGQQVKLQLEPVDPRSIMQGDYVILNYTISQLGERNIEWDNRWDKDLRHGQRLQVVLKPDEHEVHQFKELYVGQAIEEGEIVINGTYRGWRVLFGIESYFVPEGTGLEVEETAKYAYVRISKTGNAILEQLSDN